MKMQLKYLLFLFVLSTSLVGCSFMPDELKTAEQLIKSNPDSALHILQNISPRNYNNGKSRALYGLLMFHALDSKMMPLKPDSLIDYSIDWYQNHPDHNRLSDCYFYKGRIYKNAFQYEKAVELYLKALDSATDKEDYLLLAKINSDLGDIYDIQGEYIQARKKYFLTYNYFKKAKLFNFAYFALIDIGTTHYQTKEYNKANKYFQTVYVNAKDSITKGAALDETALCYYNSKKIDSALFYFRKVINYPYLGYNRALRNYNLARVYFDMNQIDSAYYYASNTFKYDPPIRTQRDCYRILTNSEYLRGNMSKMSENMNKYVNLSDSIRKIDAQIKGSYMETTYIARKEANESKIQKWISWSLILILIICFLFLMKFIIGKMKKEKAEMKEIHTEEKIEIHKKVIEDKGGELKQHIEDRKKAILTEFKNAGLQERELQLRKIYKELLHYDDPALFFSEMDKVLNGLITKLKSRYNTITEKELILCCYILLHIPTYDMLILYGYKSDNSLKSLKKRLPPKFNLENVSLLEPFLLGILSED